MHRPRTPVIDVICHVIVQPLNQSKLDFMWSYNFQKCLGQVVILIWITTPVLTIQIICLGKGDVNE